MSTIHATGTLLDQVVRLDEPVDLPANTRVSLTITPLVTAEQSSAAWEALKQRLALRPIHSGGQRFSRDELHERD